MTITYIIKSCGLHKIGKTIDLEQRINDYNTHNPEFEIIKTINGDYEQDLHNHFKDKRIKLEWFNLNQEDINNIDNIISSTPVKYKVDESFIKLKGWINGDLGKLIPENKKKILLLMNRSFQCYLNNYLFINSLINKKDNQIGFDVKKSSILLTKRHNKDSLPKN